MSLRKIANPVEYSFHIWISCFPDSSHWKDKERFFQFAKTVCRYNATKWKNVRFLEKEILKRIPNFDLQRLEYLLTLYHDLITFYATPPLTTTSIADEDVGEGYYLKIEIKNGVIHKKELPLKKREVVR